MKFLWYSNAPWVGTGYGGQTQLMLSRLLELGHEPTCFCFYGLKGGAIEYEGYRCVPGSTFDDWGNDVIGVHTQREESEAVISLVDLFVLNIKIWNELSVPWLAWIPVDSITIGKPTMDRMPIVDFPVAMSLHGVAQMQNEGVEPAAMIYHAVDSEIFKPLDRAESREMLGIPEDVYLIGMVMANKGGRKQYPLQLEAVRQWQEKNPDIDVRVYIHTEPTAQMSGFDMRALVQKIGLEGKVFSTNQYDTSVVPLTPHDMAKVYNAFDVLMNCSAGEGFGIPIVEAQACGIPVLTTNATAMPELTHNGYTVETQNVELAAHMGWMTIPSVEDMVYRLECVYRMLGTAESVIGRSWVINNCSPEYIATQWDRLLQTVQQEREERIGERRQVLA